MTANYRFWFKKWWGIVLALFILVSALSFASGTKPVGHKAQTPVAATNTKTATQQSRPQTPAPVQSHSVQYQFSLFGGSLSSLDEQNVGISWHDPTTGRNQLPNDIQSAVQQINAGSYTVSYQVGSVNLSSLRAGVTNYSDPDAVITCTILVDGNSVDSEAAPKSGYADCSGDTLDSKSGT